MSSNGTNGTNQNDDHGQTPNLVPNVIVRPPVLEQTNVKFFDEGEYAGFTIGNSTLRLHYEDALRFSQMLRLHAKRAKRRAGDVSRHWSAVALPDEGEGK